MVKTMDHYVPFDVIITCGNSYEILPPCWCYYYLPVDSPYLAKLHSDQGIEEPTTIQSSSETNTVFVLKEGKEKKENERKW